MRIGCAILAIFAMASAGWGQTEPGWTFYGRFQGSVSDSATILKVDPSVGYTFNEYLQAYAGLPIYFVDGSSTTSTITSTNQGFETGIGNAYGGFMLSLDNPVVRYTSNLVITAPTGDEDRGFSTGRATVDWSNTFSRSFSSLTPYASVGLANTVSDTSFFVRPFSSSGFVSHFDGGALYDLGPFFNLGGSAYAVRAQGEQRIVTREQRTSSSGSGAGPAQGRGRREQVTRTPVITVVPAEVANDHGFSTWFSVTPKSSIDFQIGFNRSIANDLNSLFFGIGFRIGN